MSAHRWAGLAFLLVLPVLSWAKAFLEGGGDIAIIPCDEGAVTTAPVERDEVVG